MPSRDRIQQKLNPKAEIIAPWDLLSHHDIEYHHQYETDGKADGAEVGMLAAGGFGNEFFYYNVEHSACCKGKHVRKDGHE